MKQHWVPRSYLDGWCDPDTPDDQDPYLWRFGKDEREGRRKAPHNIFAETDFYTIRLPDGTKDLALERGLSTLESEFAHIRRDVIAARAALSGDDRAWLCAFTAAMHGRTSSQRDHWKRQWQEVVEIGEQMKQAYERRTLGERIVASSIRSDDDGPTLSEDDVKRLADQPIQHMLPSLIRTEMAFLPAMNLTIFCTDDDLGFITSDRPCVWFDVEAFKKPFPFNQPVLASRTIEITMPLSPNHCALLSWFEGDDTYIDIDRANLYQLNRRTRFSCVEHFIARRNHTKEFWFDPVATTSEAQRAGFGSKQDQQEPPVNR